MACVLCRACAGVTLVATTLRDKKGAGERDSHHRGDGGGLDGARFVVIGSPHYISFDYCCFVKPVLSNQGYCGQTKSQIENFYTRFFEDSLLLKNGLSPSNLKLTDVGTGTTLHGHIW